jgi:murein DD-endopeptidase MepM/ murein hydrolase activator NlpD
MATNTHIQSGGARRAAIARCSRYASCFALTAVLVGCGATVAAAEDSAQTVSAAPRSAQTVPTAPRCFGTQAEIATTTRLANRQKSRPAYGWPLKPFNRQHPIRGFFNDPRTGDHDSHSFHFGVDISAPDGTPVYAVLGGVVHMTSGRAIAVVHAGGWSTAYWHIVPVVRHLQSVRKHQLVGRIEAPWLHVHFAERRDGEFVNPLRPGALGPYKDKTVPTIAGVRIRADGRTQDSDYVHGNVNVVVDAYDTTPMRVPAPWNDLPVTPARIRWRIVKANGVAVPWQEGVDFRYRLVRAARFDDVYAPSTQKNYPPKVGRYCFYVARAWNTRTLANGAYGLQIEAVDTRGNRTSGTVRFRIANAA